MKKSIMLILLIVPLIMTACGRMTEEPRTLKVMTHDSFSVSEGVINIFQEENGVEVQFIEAGNTGTALNKAILSKNAPLADVFYGVDNTFISRALEEGIFEPYDSPLLAEIPDRFKLASENLALPVDFGDVCPNYDIGYFEQVGLKPPQDLDDLRDPAYKGLLVVENPATSSPGLAFLFTTIRRYGEQGYLDYWRDLVENEVMIVNDWETAYYNEFSRWGGTRPIVISYGSSPPFEVIFAEEPMDEPFLIRVISQCQSTSVCSAPSGLVDLGKRSLMKVTLCPTKTSSSIVTPSHIKVWLEILQLAPMWAFF